MLDLAPETEALIKARSAATGKTPDEVITEALTASAARNQEPLPKRRVDREALEALLKKWAAMPTYDTRPAKEILDEAWGA